MGKYVNETSKRSLGATYTDKRIGLIEDGAQMLEGEPVEFVENLVCLVDNGSFAAAGYCFYPDEFFGFANPKDKRPKTWFIWDKVKEYAN